MNNQVSLIKKYFWLAVLFITIMSLTFLIMPVANYIASGWQQRFFLVFVGIVFWFSLIGGYTLLIIVKKKYKELIQKEISKQKINNKIPCFLRFFSNKFAIIADIMLIVDVIAITILIICAITDGFLPYIALAILVFSINMHCLFNGNIFVVIRNDDERGKENA